jgi:hypothetical protein
VHKQGLIVQADAVSTPYSYEECSVFLILPESSICLSWKSIMVESAPFIPPFTYNNQCSSVLLTSYIPVLIIGFSIQLVLSVIMPVILYQAGKYLHLAGIIHRNIVNGILWPEFWIGHDNSDLAILNKTMLGKDSTIILNINNVMCFHVLNNVVLMLTFGMCSPVLAAAVTCVVVLKMNVLLLLVGRFTAVLGGRECEIAQFALVTLAAATIPLNKVLKDSFWLIV